MLAFAGCSRLTVVFLPCWRCCCSFCVGLSLFVLFCFVRFVASACDGSSCGRGCVVV